jgi:hypothetical protein
VSEATLASLVAEVRDALGERGREARFIRTVHGFGYAFAGSTCDSVTSRVASFENWLICNGREQPLGDGEHLIGRDPDVAISLRSPTVSRYHAKIAVTGGLAILEDLGSKNGTWVRSQAVTSAVELIDGDRIRIGAFELTYRSLSGAGSTETQPR